MSRKRNMAPLHEVVELILQNDLESYQEFTRRHNAHVLTGRWSGSRECHVCNVGDWLLVWAVRDGLAVFQRTGTHDEIFRHWVALVCPSHACRAWVGLTKGHWTDGASCRLLGLTKLRREGSHAKGDDDSQGLLGGRDGQLRHPGHDQGEQVSPGGLRAGAVVGVGLPADGPGRGIAWGEGLWPR